MDTGLLYRAVALNLWRLGALEEAEHDEGIRLRWAAGRLGPARREDR